MKRICKKLLFFKLNISRIPLWPCMAIMLTCSCSNNGQEAGADETNAARLYGKEQALRLLPSENLDSIEMEKVLIDVRVRESALRQIGEEKIADCYMESFLSTLDSVNPSLHDELTSGAAD